MLNTTKIKSQFPILDQEINDYPLVYLDSAATTQKPTSVLNAVESYYLLYNANVHRGIHTLSQHATAKMESVRKKIQKFIGAEHLEEIVFTKGTTEGVNLVASSFRKFVKKGDNILVSYLEHHSNIVPWQFLCKKAMAELRVIPLNDKGELDLSSLPELIDERTKMVAVGQVSNSVGVVNPVQEIISYVRENSSAKILIDGAQAVPHFTVNVKEMDCDFYVFSGHKMYAPMGIGVLYGKKEVLEKLPPYHGGGEMIATCSFKKTTFADLPFRLEAGTPNVGGIIGIGAAIDFMNDIGMDKIQAQEHEILQYAMQKLKELEELTIYAPDAPHSGAISFNMKGTGISSDIGLILDKMGIAVRTGHHCAQPVMEHYGVAGMVRASFAIYNSTDNVDRLITGLKKAIMMLK